MKKTLTYMLIILLMVALIPAYAAQDRESRNPLGCRDVGYKFWLKTLKLLPDSVGDEQSMYFIRNKSNSALSLYQLRDTGRLRSVYLNHTIPAKRWAVLSTSEPIVSFACTVKSSGQKYGTIVDCSENLQVCEYNNVVYGLNNRGNYWIVKGNTSGGAVREVIRYGIIPAS